MEIAAAHRGDSMPSRFRDGDARHLAQRKRLTADEQAHSPARKYHGGRMAPGAQGEFGVPAAQDSRRRRDAQTQTAGRAPAFHAAPVEPGGIRAARLGVRQLERTVRLQFQHEPTAGTVREAKQRPRRPARDDAIARPHRLLVLERDFLSAREKDAGLAGNRSRVDDEPVFRLSGRSHPYGKERNAQHQDFEFIHALSCGSGELPKPPALSCLKDIPGICKRLESRRAANPT